jgi:hypothetical protein
MSAQPVLNDGTLTVWTTFSEEDRNGLIKIRAILNNDGELDLETLKAECLAAASTFQSVWVNRKDSNYAGIPNAHLTLRTIWVSTAGLSQAVTDVTGATDIAYAKRLINHCARIVNEEEFGPEQTPSMRDEPLTSVSAPTSISAGDSNGPASIPPSTQ